MLYGKPEGFKERVLAILTDSSTELRKKLGVLGFTWNPLAGFWARSTFQAHVVDAIRSFGVQPSDAVLDEENERRKKA